MLLNVPKLRLDTLSSYREPVPRKGLLTGIYLFVISLHDLYIQRKMPGKNKKGEKMFILWINLSLSDTDIPFVTNRRQFPMILVFTMAVNLS